MNRSLYTVKIWVHSNLKLLIYFCTSLYLGYFHHVEQGLSDNPADNTFQRWRTREETMYVNHKSPSGGWKSFIQGNKVSAYIAAGPDHWLWRTNEVKWEWHCASLLVAAQGVNWRAQSHGRLHYGDRRQLWAGGGGAISWEPRVRQTAGWAHTIRWKE